MKNIPLNTFLNLLCLSFLAILLPTTVFAKTDISGSISVDTTWSAVNSPYVVSGHIYIPANRTLTIEPGVTVKFKTDAYISVGGSLNVTGTSIDKVYFTSFKDDSVGGDTNGDGTATAPTPTDWQQVRVYSGGQVTIQNTIIRYGGSAPNQNCGYPITCSGGIFNNGGTINLSNSEILKNGQVGIHNYTGITNVSSSNINDYEQAFKIEGGEVTISNSNISNSSNVGIFARNSQLILHNNTFSNNSRDTDLATVNFIHSNNNSLGDSGGGFYIHGTLLGGTVLTKDNIPYVVPGSLYVSHNRTATIEAGVVIKFKDDAFFGVFGDLNVIGTNEDKVHFTSFKDDSVGGDTNGDGSLTTPAPGDWQQVQIHPGATAYIDEAVFSYGGAGAFQQFHNCGYPVTCRGGISNNGGTINLNNSEVFQNSQVGIHQKSGTMNVNSSEIKENTTGVFVEGGAIIINNSLIYDNSSFGVNNVSSVVVNAIENWWGDQSGPFHSTENMLGQGNKVSNEVDFVPFLTQAPFGFPSEPEIDPLLLQYEPILYLHENENYQPMNVEAFIGASALWSTDGIGDTLLKARSTTNPVTIDDIGVSDSLNWYLSFSGDGAKTFDPIIANLTYKNLVATDTAKTTYYAYKMEDSFTDENGDKHEFIVLQYWYFYAFNDWAAHGGRNNHEGDWESVFIFLDKNTKVPQYVAYSAHLNDGELEPINPFQYDSVRRNWSSSEVRKNGDQVKSFVALGSHANYPNNNGGIHNLGLFKDKTSEVGDSIESSNWIVRDTISENNPIWMNYEGKWGADMFDITGASDGPQGPSFISPLLGGGVARFHEPIKWAGIDKYTEKTLTSNTLIFTNQTTSMYFTENQPVDSTVSVDLHKEAISFGEKLNSIQLLPSFWDIESSLENGTFEVDIEFGYSKDELTSFGVNEDSLSVFYYNDVNNIWEQIPSTVNTQTSTVSFTTTHFSRYAIGASMWESVTDILNTMDIHRGLKNELTKRFEKAKETLDKGESEKAIRTLNRIIKRLEIEIKKNTRRIGKRGRRQRISTEDAQTLINLVEQLRGGIVR